MSLWEGIPQIRPNMRKQIRLSYQEGWLSCLFRDLLQLCPCLCAALLLMSWHHIQILLWSGCFQNSEHTTCRNSRDVKEPCFCFEVNHFYESLEAGTNQSTFFSNQNLVVYIYMFLLTSRNITLIRRWKHVKVVYDDRRKVLFTHILKDFMVLWTGTHYNKLPYEKCYELLI